MIVCVCVVCLSFVREVCVCVCVCEEDIDRIVATDAMTIQASRSLRSERVCYATIH